MTFEEFKEKYQNIAVQEVSSSPPMNPVVSVLVQTYQQKEFIRECLESILMQETTFDFEILIGEDGSKDGTREICLEYADKYPEKIRLFLHHRENQIKVMGESTSNFNAFYNFYSAFGEYIAFCEGDDLWNDPLKLQKQVGFLKANPDFGFVYHSFITVNEKGEKFESPEELNQPKLDISPEELFKGIYHPLLLTTCFRNVFSEIPLEMTEILNVDTFMFSYLGKYGKAKFQAEIDPAFYRKHIAGTWSHRIKEKKFLSKINTFNKLSEYYFKENLPVLASYYRNQMNSIIKMLGWFYLKERKFKKYWDSFLSPHR